MEGLILLLNFFGQVQRSQVAVEELASELLEQCPLRVFEVKHFLAGPKTPKSVWWANAPITAFDEETATSNVANPAPKIPSTSDA